VGGGGCAAEMEVSKSDDAGRNEMTVAPCRAVVCHTLNQNKELFTCTKFCIRPNYFFIVTFPVERAKIFIFFAGLIA